MIKLDQRTKTFNDCTSGYDVTLDKQYTVKEFIDEVLTKDEWGRIGILDEKQALFMPGNPYCEYKRGVLLSEIPNEYLDKIVIKATAWGGWSNMDYKLII